MSGSLTYRVRGRDLTLSAHAGQVMVLPAGAGHQLVSSSDDVALWVLELNGAASLPWLDQARVLTPDPASRRAVVAGARSIWLRPAWPDVRRLQAELWDVLKSPGWSANNQQPSQGLHPAVVRAKQVCESSVEQELDVGRLARASGLSASRLAHLFSEQLGITPLQYRNFARVQHFIRSYKGDDRNLLGAALSAGFGSYAQFHRVFRQVCGEAPAVHFRWLSDSGEVDAQTTLGATVDGSADGAQVLCASS